MSEYRLSIATADNLPFVPLQVCYNRPKAERIAKSESRMYPGCRIVIEWVQGDRPHKIGYKYGRKIRV